MNKVEKIAFAFSLKLWLKTSVIITVIHIIFSWFGINLIVEYLGISYEKFFFIATGISVPTCYSAFIFGYKANKKD